VLGLNFAFFPMAHGKEIGNAAPQYQSRSGACFDAAPNSSIAHMNSLVA
jgi:hypothetical protein